MGSLRAATKSLFFWMLDRHSLIVDKRIVFKVQTVLSSLRRTGGGDGEGTAVFLEGTSHLA